MPEERVWELVDAVARAIPFRKEKVEALLGATLEPDQEDGERIYYRARSLQPGPAGVALSAVDLRVRKVPPASPGLLSIRLQGPTVSRRAVERRFPGGDVEHPRPGPPPQGVSPDNHISYVVTRDWGQLVFGFQVRAPEVLHAITFKPGRAR